MTPSGCPVTPGFPIRRSPDHSLFDSYPRHIAAYHVLHRLSTPRHPPCTLSNLTTLMRGCHDAAEVRRLQQHQRQPTNKSGQTIFQRLRYSSGAATSTPIEMRASLTTPDTLGSSKKPQILRKSHRRSPERQRRSDSTNPRPHLHMSKSNRPSPHHQLAYDKLGRAE